MKKRMAGLAMLSCASVVSLAFVAPALAQSSVTVYGLLDLGVNYTDNKDGGSLRELRSGNTYTSRLGFRGREDMGDGLNAIFNLESGIAVDTGSPSSATQFFNRQSWVGLSKQGVGQVTLGLQLPTISDVFVPWANASYFGTQAAALDGAAAPAGSPAARFNNMIGGTRVMNSIKATSASFGGFKLGAMAVASEGSTTSGSMQSLGLSYTIGSVDAGLAYHQVKCPGDCSATKRKDEIVGIGAAWRFVPGGLLGSFYTREKNAKNVKGADANVFSLLALYPIDLWTLMAGYQKLDDRTSVDQDTQQFNLGVKYSLSKRTELYTLYSSQRVDHAGKAGMYSELSSNNKQSQFNVGLRHSF